MDSSSALDLDLDLEKNAHKGLSRNSAGLTRKALNQSSRNTEYIYVACHEGK